MTTWRIFWYIMHTIMQSNKKASQLKDLIHIEFRQATQLWCLEVVEFPIEIVALLFLSTGIIV